MRVKKGARSSLLPTYSIALVWWRLKTLQCHLGTPRAWGFGKPSFGSVISVVIVDTSSSDDVESWSSWRFMNVRHSKRCKWWKNVSQRQITKWDLKGLDIPYQPWAVAAEFITIATLSIPLVWWALGKSIYTKTHIQISTTKGAQEKLTSQVDWVEAKQVSKYFMLTLF